MIPRYQRILFYTLAACIALMTLFLLRGCQQAHKRLTAVDAAAPIAAPTATATEAVTLYLASDADNAIAPVTRNLALPQEPTTRARLLLDHLFAEYATPDSHHPLPPGPAIDDVFFLPLPKTTPDSPDTQLAVVNLHGTFLTAHPADPKLQDLTLQSILATLHAAFPQLIQVRFLVDGQPGQFKTATSGHADLQATYPASDAKPNPIPQETPVP